MGKIIGIDLGTVNSCVAIMERGEALVIPNAEGSRTTPSIVAFNTKGERLVGHIAKRQAATNPEQSFFAIKRLIGRKFDAPEVKRFAQMAPFPVVPSPNGDAWLKIGEKLISPPEISALVLQKMKETAEEYLGEEVTDAIITVPAYFDDSQRQATKDAGRIAGLNVERIINEPTAAALAHSLEKQENGIVAVFDLGGGTFDITILEISKDVFQVRATCGDTFLGGEDFDMRIVDWLADGFRQEHNIDLRTDRMALQRLKEAAEKAKQELSSTTTTDINLPFISSDTSGPKHLTTKLTRTTLESLVEDLIERIAQPCETALTDAGLKPENIEHLLLVGGMTRMPKVAEKARALFKKSPKDNVNPDEAIAVGAAIQSGIIRGDVSDVLLLDVTPLSLGVETQGGVTFKIIHKNTTIPTTKSEVFSTTLDNQDMVKVHVVQGERERVEDNKSLAVFELVGIPPAPRGVPQIEVTFEIDTNGIVSASAKDLGTGLAQSIRINATSGLSEDQIQTIIADAEAHARDDEQIRALVGVKNELEGLLYSAKRSLSILAQRLDPTEAASYQTILQQSEGALKSMDYRTVKEALDNLNEFSHRIAELLYSGA